MTHTIYNPAHGHGFIFNLIITKVKQTLVNGIELIVQNIALLFLEEYQSANDTIK